MDLAKIILLDLNFTLATKVDCNWKTFKYNVAGDVYSKPLIASLNDSPHSVHLVTARTNEYKIKTVEKIQKAGLKVDAYAFKPWENKFMKAAVFKSNYVRSLFRKGIVPEQLIVIESNAETRKAYESLGIKDIYTREKYLEAKETLFGSEI